MSTPALITLLLTLAAAALLITERLRPDLVGLLVLVVLGLSGVVRPEQVFAGFSGSAVMTLLAISILSIGLQQTGVTRMLGGWMYRVGRGNETRLMLVSLLTAAGLSLFMNNIAAVGILLPAVMSLSRLSRVSPSRLLMPLAFGTVLGGMATLLTTGNIVVSGALRDAGYAGFGLLDFTPIGLPIVAVGAVYMVTAGRKLLSSTTVRTDGTALQAHHEELTALYGLNEHSCLVRVLPDCPMCGQTIFNGQWATRTGLNIMAILRGTDTILAPSVQEVIVAGDILLSHCSPLDSFGGVSGLEWVEAQNGIPELADTLHSMAEVIIAPHTTKAGRTLADIRFREKHHLNVLAVWRDGQSIRSNLSDLPLKAGDALLVQGPAVSIHLLENEPDLILLKEDPDTVLRPGKSLVALGITLLTLLIGVLEIFPVPVVMFAGAVMMLLTQCIDINEVYRAIEWRVLFLIAGMWPLSTAIRETGLAQAGIDALLGWVGPVAPLAAAALLIAVALLLTQVMSSQVASLVLAPLAITAAIPLGADPRALGMAVALGCSLAFPTPYGHPVNLMVMNPGGYRFRDFTRVGLPLTILVFATILLGLYLFWGLSF